MTSLSKRRHARAWSLLISLALLLTVAARAAAPASADIKVRVQIDGGTVSVDVEFFAAASAREVWAVITDFDNAARFISKLSESRVLSHTGETLVVVQKGSMGLGPFSVPLESVSEVHLQPFEKIQSRMISGNMKKYDSATELSAQADGTRVNYRVQSIPEVWIPPLIGPAMIEFETRSRFRQLLEEILRRKVHPETVR